MKTYNFTLKLDGIDIYSVPDYRINDYLDDISDALYKAGCDDGTFYVTEGIAYMDFDREANSLEDAIKSAKHDVESSGVCEEIVVV